MKRDLTDWLNGLGVPDEEDAPESLPLVKLEKLEKLENFEDVKAAPDVLNNLEDEAELDSLPELEQDFENLQESAEELEQEDLNLNAQEDLENLNLERDKLEVEPENLKQENLEEQEPESLADKYFDELFSPRGRDDASEEQEQKQEPDKNLDLEQKQDKPAKRFLTEQDELQNLADELLLEDKDNYNNKSEYNNYSLDDIKQLEDYVEQLESLLDEQEGVLREELSKKPESVNVKAKEIEKVKAVKEIKSEVNEDVSGVEEQLNAVFNGANNINNNKIQVRERNGEFTQQLHGALHNRKVLAIEKSELALKNAPKKINKKLKIAAACAVLLSLALAGVCVTLLYLRHKAYYQDAPSVSENLNLNNINSQDVNLDLEDENKSENEKLNELNEIKNENNENVDEVSEDVNDLNLSEDINEPELKAEAEVNSNDLEIDNNINLSLNYQDILDAGSLALNTKEWDEAILTFHRACELNKRDVTARIGLAWAYYGKGLYADALIVLNETRRKFPLDATIETMRRMLRKVK
ncbi:MAG: hypothetical protein II870_06455 [Synergistaceae bacterium]|nr:hypothetical protein [Synergistaceae bacterium]